MEALADNTTKKWPIKLCDQSNLSVHAAQSLIFLWAQNGILGKLSQAELHVSSYMVLLLELFARLEKLNANGLCQKRWDHANIYKMSSPSVEKDLLGIQTNLGITHLNGRSIWFTLQKVYTISKVVRVLQMYTAIFRNFEWYAILGLALYGGCVISRFNCSMSL